MSTNTFTCLLPSCACPSAYPFTTQLDPSLYLPESRGMSDDPGVQILDVRPKRTRQMPPESSDETNQSWHRHFHPRPAETHPGYSLRLPPARIVLDPPRGVRPPYPPNFSSRLSLHPTDPSLEYPYPYPGYSRRREGSETGEGVDMNRPGEVIDLTGDEPEEQPQQARSSAPNTRRSHSTRPPRSSRPISTHNVVNLIDDLDDPTEAAEGPPSSPEVQYVGSASRPNPLSLPLPRPYHAETLMIGNRPSPEGVDYWRRLPSELRFGASLDRFSRSRVRDAAQTVDWDHSNDGFESENYSSLSASIRRARRDIHNLTIDYGLASFPMMATPPRRTQVNERPTYKPPSPAPEGFTRTLTDEDVAICPHCSCELGVGEGKKQEIWVAKPCGHVYCGECAENRSKSKAKKTNGSQKIKPFAKCQVPGCGKQISSPTAMFHLYL